MTGIVPMRGKIMSDLLLAGLLGWLFGCVGFLIIKVFYHPPFEHPAKRIVRIIVRFSGVIMFAAGITTMLAAIFVGVFGPWI